VQSTSAELAAAITAQSTTMRPVLTVDFEGNGHQENTASVRGYLDDLSEMVVSLTRDQIFETDLPEQVRIVRGTNVAELSARLDRGRPTGARPAPFLRSAGSVVNGASYATSQSFTLNGTQGTPPVAAKVGDYVVAFVSLGSAAVYFHPAAVPPITPGAAELEPWVPLAEALDGQLRTRVFGKRIRSQDDLTSFMNFWPGVYGSFVTDMIATAVSVAWIVVGSPTDGLPGVLGVHKIAMTSLQNINSPTILETGSITTTLERCLVFSHFARLVSPSGTWTGSDTELTDVVGTHGTTNIAVATYQDATERGPGTYSKQATASAGAVNATMTVLALGIVQDSDERQHPGWLWSPANLSSPFALAPAGRNGQPSLPTVGRDVSLAFEYLTTNGPQRVQRMRGRTRTFQVSGRNRAVDLRALDYREFLRSTTVLPPIYGDWEGLNATWLISSALASVGVLAAPWRHDESSFANAQALYMSCHGSLKQEGFFGQQFASYPVSQYTAVERNASGNRTRPTFVTGPYALGAYAAITSTNVWTRVELTNVEENTTAATLLNGQQGGRVEFWVRGDTYNNALFTQNELTRFRLPLDPSGGANNVFSAGIWRDGKLFAWLDKNGVVDFQVFGPTVAQDGLWHKVGIHWDFATGTKKIYWYLDGAETNTTVTPTTSVLTGELGNQLSIRSYLPIAEIHRTWCPNPAVEDWLWELPFTAEALLDMSELELTACYDGHLREVWSLLHEIATAEQAVVYFDESGVLRYRTRKRLSDPQGATVQATVTAEHNILEIDINSGIDTVRNVITVPYTAVLPPTTSLAYLYQLTNGTLMIPPSGFALFDVAFNPSAYSVSMAIAALSAAPGSPGSYACLNTAADGSGSFELIFAPVSFNNGWTSSGATIRIENQSTVPLYLRELGIAGLSFRVQPSADTTYNPSSYSRIQYGEQPLPVSSSQWVQTLDVATKLAVTLWYELRYPVPYITRLRIRGDPRLQLADRILIVDSAGIYLTGAYWVTGITDVYGPGGYVMDIDCRQALDVAVFDEAVWDDTIFAQS